MEKRVIPDVKYDEYEYLKSSMNDLDQMVSLWVENP
jgi:hypothetical protein